MQFYLWEVDRTSQTLSWMPFLGGLSLPLTLLPRVIIKDYLVFPLMPNDQVRDFHINKALPATRSWELRLESSDLIIYYGSFQE